MLNDSHVSLVTKGNIKQAVNTLSSLLEDNSFHNSREGSINLSPSNSERGVLPIVDQDCFQSSLSESRLVIPFSALVPSVSPLKTRRLSIQFPFVKINPPQTSIAQLDNFFDNISPISNMSNDVFVENSLESVDPNVSVDSSLGFRELFKSDSSENLNIDNLFDSIINESFEGFSSPIQAIVNNSSHIYNLGERMYQCHLLII